MYVPVPNMIQHSWYPLAFAIIVVIYIDAMRTQISKTIMRWYVCDCCQVRARKRRIFLHSRV